MDDWEFSAGLTGNLPALAYGDMILSMLERILDLPSSVLGNLSYLTETTGTPILLPVPSPEALTLLWKQGLDALKAYRINTEEICRPGSISAANPAERERQLAEAVDVLREATIKIAGETLKGFHQHQDAQRELLDHLQELDFVVRQRPEFSPAIKVSSSEPP